MCWNQTCLRSLNEQCRVQLSFLCDQQHIACCDALLIAKQWVLKSILLPSASRCDVAAELWAGLINRLLQQRKLKHISLQGQQILSLEQAAQQMLPISSKPSDSGKLLNNDVTAVSCWARMMRGWAQCFKARDLVTAVLNRSLSQSHANRNCGFWC